MISNRLSPGKRPPTTSLIFWKGSSPREMRGRTSSVRILRESEGFMEKVYYVGEASVMICIKEAATRPTNWFDVFSARHRGVRKTTLALIHVKAVSRTNG